MNHSNYWISLDINKINSQLTLTLKQGETGRAIHIRLTEDGRPYQIGEGCYAALQALKTDSLNPLSHPCVVQDNTITYYVQPNITSTVGKVACEVALYSDDGQLILSSSFTIVVFSTVYGELEEQYEPEKNTLSQIIAEANSTVAEIERMRDNGEFNAGFAETMNVTTTTGEAGSEASVAVTTDESTPNTAKKFNFDFTIPRGEKGEQGIQGEQGVQGIQGEKGDTATVRIGTVTTGKPNTEAKVTNTGTTNDAVLNFTLPIGEQAVRILTKAEFDALETKEDGIIYVFSDDDTWETTYKYSSESTDFSTIDKLLEAPAGCYNSDNVYLLNLIPFSSYTLFIGGTALNRYQIVNLKKRKTILAVEDLTGKVYAMSYSYANVDNFYVGWNLLNNPAKKVLEYGQSVDGVITMTGLNEDGKAYWLAVEYYETHNDEITVVKLPPILARSHKSLPPSIASVEDYYLLSGAVAHVKYAFIPQGTTADGYKYKLLQSNNGIYISRFGVTAYEI